MSLGFTDSFKLKAYSYVLSCQLSVKRRKTSWEFVLDFYWKLKTDSLQLCFVYFTDSFKLTAYSYVLCILLTALNWKLTAMFLAVS